MKVIGKDIGGALDAMYAEIERRARVEAECALRVVPLDGGAFSSVDWEPGVVTIAVHNGVQRRALGHVFGVALQHVRQRLDHYPDVEEGAQDVEMGDLVRVTLRELVMAPEAEVQLAPLGLETTWEAQQRHAGLKDLLQNAPADWNEADTPGMAFAALQYARFTIEHPAELWAALRGPFTERMPVAAERGEAVVARVREHGWASAGACLESLVAAREELGIKPYASIVDLRNGTVL
ncbi:MAG: hypothetical protein EXR64_04355 [Dehalococcoidia bacterium]|nr:hypothetical protein [Dehalococcoidia bacterium]